MKLDLGWTVVIISVAIFYLRLIQIRGRRRKEVREEELARIRSHAKRKPGDPPLSSSKNRPTFQVASWWLVGSGAVIMLVGLAMRTPGVFPEAAMPYWWVVTAVGVLIFTFSMK